MKLVIHFNDLQSHSLSIPLNDFELRIYDVLIFIEIGDWWRKIRLLIKKLLQNNKCWYMGQSISILDIYDFQGAVLCIKRNKCYNYIENREAKVTLICRGLLKINEDIFSVILWQLKRIIISYILIFINCAGLYINSFLVTQFWKKLSKIIGFFIDVFMFIKSKID